MYWSDLDNPKSKYDFPIFDDIISSPNTAKSFRLSKFKNENVVISGHAG